MKAKKLAIIDYGMGNLHSVASAINKVAPDCAVNISSDASIVAEADHVIFPGVGAIRDCMVEIYARGADKMVSEAIAAKKPLLGICVGMQALMEFSEENNGVAGLAVMQGQVKRFPTREQLATLGQQEADFKVPHMGWNQVEQSLDHPLWHNINNGSRFYFVHSYYVDPATVPANTAQHIAGRCRYGIDFCAAMTMGSLFAVQFHPEKSHTDGLQLLKNFIGWDGSH